MSLKLKDNVLIMDEAHGLTAALENAHCAPVSARHLSSVKTFLQLYINKYRARLSSKNLLSLNQLNYVVGKMYGKIFKLILLDEFGTVDVRYSEFVIFFIKQA